MKKFRAKTALIIFPLALALLQGGRALDTDTKYKLVPNGVQYMSSAQLSPSTTRTKEEELLKKVLPLVTFDCFGKTGYFSDAQFQCEVFHYCKSNGIRNTFHCPPNLIFNQLSMLCEEKTEANKKLCSEGSITTKSGLWTPLKVSAPTASNSLSTNSPSLLRPINANKNITEKKSTVDFQHLMSMMKSDNASKVLQQSKSSIVDHPSRNTLTKFQNNTIESDKIITASISVAPLEEGMAHEVVSSKIKDGNADGMTARKLDLAVPLETKRQRKPRQHRRQGRVLDLERSGTETVTKRYSDDAVAEPHVDGFSTTEPSQIASSNDTNDKPQGLFSVSSDRIRSKDYRKRRRNNRRRKPSKLVDGVTAEPLSEGNPEIETTTPNIEANSTQLFRRKTLLSEKEVGSEAGDSWQGMINPQEKRRKNYKIHSFRESKQANDSATDDSNRNPYFKKTNNNKHDFGFGDRNPGNNENSEHHHQYDGDHGSSMGPSDYFGGQELPNISDEWSAEENHPTDSEKNRNRKKKRKPSREKKHPYTESVWPPESQEDYDEPTAFSDTTFPPPKSFDHPKFGSDLDIGEDEFRTKTPYKDHYFPEVKELADLEKNRWKVSDHNDMNKKINVGDSMDNSGENLKPNFLMNAESMQKSIQAMNAIKASVKQLPKHTAAHQHLSKLMNEFFSMSTQVPSGLSVKSVQTGANIHIPKYRIPDEDIYKADAVAEPVHDLPQEVLDVVEFIAEQQAMKKEEDQPDYNNHEIVNMNSPMKDILEAELEKLFSGKEANKFSSQPESTQGIFKQLVFTPEGGINSDEDDEQEFKEIAELASFTSQRIEPLLKSVMSNEKSFHVVPLSNGQHSKQNVRPISLAETVPVRVIYRQNILPAKPTSQAIVMPPPQKSNFKLIRARLPRPKLQVIHNNRMVTSPNSQFVILQPPILVPSHSPPAMSHSLPSMLQYSRLPLVRPLMRSPYQFRSGRRKRSLANRLKRQVSYNPNNNPFYNPFFKTFSPTFTPNFRNFRNLFGSPSSVLLNTAGTHNFPFTFPTVQAPKLQRPLQQNFVPPRQNLRHGHQTSHQTMVVDDVPFPVHVDVQPPLFAQTSQLRSSRPAQQPFHSQINPTGSRRPSQIHQPPLMNNNFLKPVSIKNDDMLAPFPLNIQPSTLPLPPVLNHRPPFLNLKPPNSNQRAPVQNLKPAPLRLPTMPSNFADHILPLALPLSHNPIPRPNGQAKPLLYSPYNPVKPIPHTIRNQLIGHLNSFPGMGKPGAGPRNPSNHYRPNHHGLLMHSGYKPPKTSKPLVKPNNSTNRNNYHKKLHSSQPEPPAGYLEVTYKKNVGRTTPKPTRAYDSRYSSNSSNKKKEKPFGMPQIRTPLPPKPYENPNLRPIPIYSYTGSNPSLSSEEIKPKRKRPSRRRRPRPRPSGPYLSPSKPLSPVSPTPPPPQQIPPPPADFTSKPYRQSGDVSNSIHPIKVEAQSTNDKQQNIFPPAGYYGRDQLGQFFENIKKNEQKAISSPPSYSSEKTLNDGVPLSTASSSKEDIELDEGGDSPVFGARIRSKTRRKGSGDSQRSQTQRKETRTKQNFQEPPREMSVPPASINTYVEPNRPRNPPQPPRRRKPNRSYRPPEKTSDDSGKSELQYPKPVTPSPGFFNVPGGLGNIVDPSAQLQPGGIVPRDMFGIPIPFGDQNIFSSSRPGEPNHRDFFSVPGHVAKQQLSSLQKLRPNVFLPPTEGPLKNPTEPSVSKSSPEGRPKRRKRIKVKGRPKVSQGPPRTTTSSTESFTTEPEFYSNSGASSLEDKAILSSTTRLHHKPTLAPKYVSDRRYAESGKKANLPPTLQEVSKSLLEGKLDIRKLNATISTSVSVSAGNKGRSAENEPRKVFSSKNGGLAVIKNGPRQRKRYKPARPSDNKDEASSTENTIKSDEKLQIASSVLDIIKATSESEMKHTTTDPSMSFSSTRLAKTWILKPPDDHDTKTV